MALTPAYFETDNVTGQEQKLVGSGGPLVSNSAWLSAHAEEHAAMGVGYMSVQQTPRPAEELYLFATEAGLTGTGSQTITTDSGYTYNGNPTVKVEVAAGATGGVQKTGLSVPLRTKSLTVLAYVADYTTVAKIQPFISQGATLTPNYSHYSTYNPATAGQRNYNGIHYINVTADMFTNAGTGITADGTAVQVLRVDVQASAGAGCSVNLIGAWVNLQDKTRFFITFDDGRKSVINNAFPIAQGYRIPCTAYLIPPRLGTTGAVNFMSQAETDKLHSAGWCNGNHGYNASGTTDSFAELGLAAYIAEVEQCRDWLRSAGYRGALHHAYVEGSYDGTLVPAMAAAGMETGRTIAGNTTTGAQCESVYFGNARRFVLSGGIQLNSSNALAAVKAEVDRAIRDGRSLIITGHDIFTTAEGGATATSWTVSDFNDLCAYIAAYRADGRCEILPMDKFY